MTTGKVLAGRKQKITVFFCFFMIFLGFVLFYTRVVPLVIYNMDDWSFLRFKRNPWPVWGIGNPSRVLPEFLMPLTAWCSAYALGPVTGDLIRSVEIGMAVAVSIAVTAYSWFFYRMMTRKYRTSVKQGILLTVLFVVFHFLVFRTKSSDNDYLLAGFYDTTTFFFYLIPALWNASLVMYFHTENYFRTRTEKPLTARAAVLLAIYFGVFSNLYQSAILAIYTGVDLLLYLVKNRRSLHFKEMALHIIILVLWVVSLVFEYFGGRAKQVGAQDMDTLMGRLGSSFESLTGRLTDINIVFLVLLVVSLALFIVVSVKRNKSDTDKKHCKDSGGFLLYTVLLLLYEWILCGASFALYVQRGDVLICAFFFLFLFMITQLNRISSEVKSIRLIFPLTVVICFLCLFTPGRTWLIRTNDRVDAPTARKITSEIVSACVAADEAGEEAVDVSVPMFKGNNWPLSLGGASSVSKALFIYGQTGKKLKITFVPDKEKNKQYGLTIPK